MVNKAFIGIGSNEGDKKYNIDQAIEMIKEKATIVNTSSTYETEPYRLIEDLDWFLNCCIEIETKLSAKELIKFLEKIEEKLGRNMGEKGKEKPRPIDLDVLFFNDEIIKEGDVQIPHIHIENRAYVLVPLNDIAPNLKHPVLKKIMAQLLKELKDEKQVIKI